jgi:hypothetical protein
MKIALLFALILIVSIGIAVYLLNKVPMPGVHLEIYGGKPNSESWVFDAPLLPSYHDYYCRAWGFQDTRYFVAVSGTKEDIDKLLVALTDKLENEKESLSKYLDDIESGINESDQNNRKHGWNIRDATNIQWWSGYKGHVVVMLDKDRNRIYYRSYTE